MQNHPHQRYWLTLVITASLLVPGLFPPIALAQNDGRKPIVISFGQPNIWSLEQAHYLLARMHMTNLELQAKSLSRDDLNPNATHGTRIQIIKQLLEIGAQYDQGIGFQNKRIVQQAEFDDTRRRELITNRDRMRAESLQLSRSINRLKSERATIEDGTPQATQLDAQIKQKTDDKADLDAEIADHNTQIEALGTGPSGELAAPTPTSSPFDKQRLPDSMLSKLTEDQLKELANPGNDPRLNATTMLDNSVQLQYEIIAKQLTLLRDEVGPGERLVFLELPQSIYSTPGSGDEKMAQSWWHVNGYTHTDPLLRLLLELYEVEWKWKKIQEVPAFQRVADALDGQSCERINEEDIRGKVRDAEYKDFGVMYFEFKCERAVARERILNNLFRQVSVDFDRVEQGGARETSKVIDGIRKAIEMKVKGTLRKDPNQEKILQTSVTSKDGREDAVKLRKDLLNILSNPDPSSKITDGEPGKPRYSLNNGDGIEFVPLDERHPMVTGADAQRHTGDIQRHTVRAVDIIPRQSSLNVNDIQNTVKATGILAAFKFLFGFAGQVNFQRQKEQFEQFIHQELYASGFGKGNNDFGWTFGALPGTKRVAPGVRTTYAALIVPDDAESLVLSARGCYFPRKNYQPVDFEDTGHRDWLNRDKFSKYNCSDQETYILPIPGGGNTSNFWVTNVNYQPVKKGDYVTVSVRGNNFSSQMGVLVNGVALQPTVGLAHPHLMPRAAPSASPDPTSGPLVTLSDCADGKSVCGRYERIDPRQIVFSFKMPNNSDIGIPTITLVAPGKSIDLNAISNIWVNGQMLAKKGETLNERERKVRFMFGERPPDTSITDLLIVNADAGAANAEALLMGSGFDEQKDLVYLNGVLLEGAAKTFKSPNLYRLTFPMTADETVKIAFAQDKTVITQSFLNPAALRITASNSTYEAPAGVKPGVLTVRLNGTGFTPPPRLKLDVDSSPESRLIYLSPTEVIATIQAPKLPVVIRLTDSTTHRAVSRVIDKLPSQEVAAQK
ncbi:MAG TPA: hypothetical protein VFR12_08775 [Pyrinomonadaceae bacterium]|nr:hypothetical protein [Pyrinomonadaceae bacterium]